MNYNASNPNNRVGNYAQQDRNLRINGTTSNMAYKPYDKMIPERICIKATRRATIKGMALGIAVGLAIGLLCGTLILSKKNEKVQKTNVDFSANTVTRVEAPEPIEDTYFAHSIVDTKTETLKTEDTQKQVDPELLRIIAKVIYVEARGECFEGKVAVGATVVNRLNSPEFPDDIKDVLKQYANIKYITDEMVSEVPECAIAAEKALKGEDPLKDELGGPTLFFYNPDLSDEDQVEARKDIKVTARIENHVFYSKWE